MRTDNPEVTINFQKAHLPTATYTFEIDGEYGKATAIVNANTDEVCVAMDSDKREHVLIDLKPSKILPVYETVHQAIQAAYTKLNGK